MGLYKLNYSNANLSNGVIEKTYKNSTDFEKYFENWLKNSPHVLLYDVEYSTFMWLGRQVPSK